jgi:hypothetical protein
MTGAVEEVRAYRRFTLIAITVRAHAAVVAIHAAAHVGSRISMAVPATVYIWFVIIIGPIAGWWLMRSERPVLGSSMVAACMTGALVFGGINHFVWAGTDHVSTIPPGIWRMPFQVTAVLLAFTEAAGVVAGIVGIRASIVERRRS